MALYLIIKKVKFYLLSFILFYFSNATEITQHYLGASLDITQKNAIFIDKFNCKANPNFEFKLSSKLKVNSIYLNGKLKEYSKKKILSSEIIYIIKRNFWESKDALITVQYQTINTSLIQEIIPNKLIRLNNNENFYPTGTESSTKIDFHLQIPDNWNIVSDGNVTRLKDKHNSYRISSNNRRTQLNLFFLKNFNDTPKINKIFLNFHSTNLDKDEKQKFIQLFLDSKNKIENLLGAYPHSKLDVIFSDYSFASNSVVFFNTTNEDSYISDIEKIFFNQYFYYSIYPENNQDITWIQAIQSYFLDYIQLLNKNPMSANLFRKEILNSQSKFLISTNLSEFSKNINDQYKIQTYLFLLFTLENLLSKDTVINKIQQFLYINANSIVDGLAFYQYMFKGINDNLKFYFSERFNSNLEYPFIEIIESEDEVSILQSEKVFPMLIPLKYYFIDGVIKDSLISTKSFKTLILDKKDKTINKIEVDPGMSCLRNLHTTEIESKIKDIFRYNNIQISISPKLENTENIKDELETQLGENNLNYTEFNNINPDSPSIIIGELPAEFKYLSTKTDIILNGRKFYIKNHCLAYTFNNQKNFTNLIIYSQSNKQIIPVIEKLKFFNNYSYFILRNGNNAEKGFHKTHSKQLSWEKK